MDTRSGIRAGGDSGPTVVSGKPKESLLLQALHWTDPDLKMPPRKEGGKLPDSDICNTPPPVIPGNSSGRLQLAQWLTTPQNPLTARVMVNRLWQHMFGEGIVGSPDNFGATGERPSHPELLDYLAVRFMKEGWSVKKTYGPGRQSIAPEGVPEKSADPASECCLRELCGSA